MRNSVLAGFAAGWLLFSVDAYCQMDGDDAAVAAPPTNVITLAELAQAADLIAVVRVEYVDYERVRSLPASGYALADVLIAYRGTERGDRLEIRAAGFDTSACYYPAPIDAEGPRFLVMLQATEDEGIFEGTRPGCMLPVYVTQQAGYALRYPIEGVSGLEAAAPAAIGFSDPYASFRDDDLTYDEEQSMLTAGYIERIEVDPDMPAVFAEEEPNLRYTTGIPIQDVRPLMRLDAPRPEATDD